MAVKEERYGERDLCFSGWHRYQLHENLDYIDLDCIEYCHRCMEPLILIEMAKDIGQLNKATTVTRKLAKMCGLPAYLVFYTGNEKKMREARVSGLRVRKIYPTRSEEVKLTPKQYELFLVLLRDRHKCYNNVSLSWWQLGYTQQDLELVKRLL
jgi:hypothetical protein